MIKSLSKRFNLISRKSQNRNTTWRALRGLPQSGVAAGRFRQINQAKFSKNDRDGGYYGEEVMVGSRKKLQREYFVGYSALASHGIKLIMMFGDDNLLEDLMKGEMSSNLGYIIQVSIQNPAYIALRNKIIKDVITPLGLDFDVWVKSYEKHLDENEEIMTFDVYDSSQELLSLFSGMDLPESLPESLTEEVIY